MSPVELGMDVLLAGLLIAAMAVGLRLNRRLRALREGQASFVRAVGELDQAAVRAEAGLSALRQATQDAHDQLLGRIETARVLAARLERAVGDAEVAAHRAEAVRLAPVAAPASRLSADDFEEALRAPRRPEPLDEPVAAPAASRRRAPSTPSAPLPRSAPVEAAEPDSPLARFVARRLGERR